MMHRPSTQAWVASPSARTDDGHPIALVAIGIGCRRACKADAITTLVERACSGLDTTHARLFTIDAKTDEVGLREAAMDLGFALTFLSVEQLRAALPGVTTHSRIVENALGISSVAEAAALAGAGPGATLVVPRLAAGGATCAVAVGSGVG